MPTEKKEPVLSLLDWIQRTAFFLILAAVPLFFSFHLTTYTIPKVVLSQVLACILLASWLLRRILQGALVFQPSELFFPVLVFFAISAVSLLHAMSLPGGLSLLWQVFAYMTLYFAVIHQVREEEIETWVLIMTLVGSIHSLYGILQYFGVEPLLQGYHYIPHIPISTLGHRNQAAQYLLLLIPLSGVFAFLTSSTMRKTLFGIGTVMMTYHFYLTRSRGGFLGVLTVFLVAAGIVLHHRLSRSPFLRSHRWVLPAGLLLLVLAPLLLLFLPGTMTLKAKYLNPTGYYIHSIDGSRIPVQQPIRIECDYRVLQGDPGKPGYINFYGERVNTPPIFLTHQGEGWNHLRNEEVRFQATPYDEEIKLRWVPGGDDSILQLREVRVETREGVSLVRDSFLNRLFSRLGVTEVDKAVSTQARLYMYRNTIRMIQDNPFLGVGFGNFKYVYPRYRDRGEWALSGLNTRVEQAHSEYLQILSEVGLIGFSAFLWILIRIGMMAFHVLRQREFSREFWLGLGCMLGIGATLIQSFFDFNLQNPASGVTFWIVVGFLEIIHRSVMEDRGEPASPPYVISLPTRRARGAVLTGVMLALVFGVSLSMRPLIGDYYLRQARFDFEMRDWQSTLENLREAQRFSRHHFDIAFHLGQTYELVKDYEKAGTFYRKAIDLYPYFIEARNNLGAVYIRLGRIDEAIEEFKGAIDVNPYHPGLHNNLGYLYSKRNLLKEALQEYHKTLELDPNNPEVHKNLGLLHYHKLGEFQKAKYYWEKYLILNPEDPQNASLRQKIEEIERRGQLFRRRSSSP